MVQPLLTIARAASIIGVSRRKVGTLADEGVLPIAARTRGGDRLFIFEDVRRVALVVMAERRADQRAKEEKGRRPRIVEA